MLINGKELSLENLSQKNISGVLKFYEIPIGTVAIEKNGNIIPLENFDKENLLETDKLEIIKFVGGG
jgi:sulfur carrier protein